MRLMRIGPIRAERPVVLDDEEALDVSSLTADSDRTWWTNGGPQRLTAARSEGPLPRADIERQRIGAPDHRYLRSGDVMRRWIDGPGRQRQDLGAA
jgi:2,4-didehydro-3-deoxy-L-rhamnonate hydrolase